jgi:hypothetical protein
MSASSTKSIRMLKKNIINTFQFFVIGNLALHKKEKNIQTFRKTTRLTLIPQK